MRVFSGSLTAISIALLCAMSQIQSVRAGQDPALQDVSSSSASAEDARADDAIKDEAGNLLYIVNLDPAAARSQMAGFIPNARFMSHHDGRVVNLVAELEREYGFQVESVVSHVATGFSAYLTEDKVAELQRDKRVLSVVKDHKLKLSAADTTAVWNDTLVTATAPPNGLYNAIVAQPTEMQSWGKRAVNQSTTTSNGSARVYVIDVGVGQHDDLNVVEWVSVVNTDLYHCGSKPGITCTQTIMRRTVGCYTHATGVAGVIGAKTNSKGTIGIDPGVQIVSVSATSYLASGFASCNNADAGFSVTGMTAAYDWVKADITAHPGTKVNVVNISVNGFDDATMLSGPLLTLATPATGYKGAFIAKSAGNDFTDACASTYTPPSVTDGIMIIGAINNHGQPVVPLNGAPGFWKSARDATGAMGHVAGSNYGSCVDAWAPGDAIFTSMSDTVDRQDGLTVYTKYGYGSGTSFASPHVAGLAAYLIETNSIYTTPSSVEQAVRGNFSGLGSRAPVRSTLPAPAGQPPVPADFHGNSTGLAVNMPTLNPLAGVKNTPYAEFDISSECSNQYGLTATPCRALNYNVDPIYPFDSNYELTKAMANRGGFKEQPNYWISFDSYGTLPYTCDTRVTSSLPGGSTLLHSGNVRYYDANTATNCAVVIGPCEIFSQTCPSAAIGLPN